MFGCSPSHQHFLLIINHYVFRLSRLRLQQTPASISSSYFLVYRMHNNNLLEIISSQLASVHLPVAKTTHLKLCWGERQSWSNLPVTACKMKVVWCSANIHQVLFIDVVPGSHSTNHRIPIIDLTLNLTSIQEEDLKMTVSAWKQIWRFVSTMSVKNPNSYMFKGEGFGLPNLHFTNCWI